ncbi:MAG: hypothetical protein AB2A00_04030 [Myxococcota bacterium]
MHKVLSRKLKNVKVEAPKPKLGVRCCGNVNCCGNIRCCGN